MRLIDADDEKLQGTLKLINEAEIQIYGPNRWRFAGQCIDAVAKAPTVEAKPTWIPCSERLPCYHEDVIISFVECFVFGARREKGEMNIDVWETEDGDILNLNDANAWMPFPEPYIESGEEVSKNQNRPD